MTPDVAIRTRLLQITALTDLVVSRIYAVTFPQGVTKPAVRVQQISREEDFHARGPIGIKAARMQVDVVAATKASADAVIEAVHGDGLGDTASGLSGWMGDLGSPPFSVRGIFPLDESESYESDELKQWRVRRDYRLVWSE